MSDEQYNRLNERWKNRPVDRRETLLPEGFDNIDDYTAALEAAAEERMRNRSREEFEGSDALKNLGIRIANSVGLYGNTRQLIENDRAAKSVRKEIKRAERRLQATDAEKNFASGVAAGIYGEADIPPSMDADTVIELADYYWAEKAVQNDLIREQRTKINRKLDERVRRLMDGVDDAKVKVPAAVIMRNRTPERNMRRIFGNARGDAINDYLFRPTQDNEAERIRFINRMHNEVRTFKDRNGKDRRLDREERALVQLVIEGRAAEDAVNAMERSRDIQNAAENIKNARKLAGKDDLAKRRQAEIDASVDEAREFNLGTDERRLAIQYSRWLETQERLEGADTTIIGNAVEKYRELFNQLYDAANDFLVAHGYEPIGFIRGTRPISRARRPRTALTAPWSAWGSTGRSESSPPPLRGERKISSRICHGTVFSRTGTARGNIWTRTLRKDLRSMWTPCPTCSITRTTSCGPGLLCGISEGPTPRRKSGTSWSRPTRFDTRRRTSRRPSCGTRGSCPIPPRRPMRTCTRPWSSMWTSSTRPSRT